MKLLITAFFADYPQYLSCLLQGSAISDGSRWLNLAKRIDSSFTRVWRPRIVAPFFPPCFRVARALEPLTFPVLARSLNRVNTAASEGTRLNAFPPSSLPPEPPQRAMQTPLSVVEVEGSAKDGSTKKSRFLTKRLSDPSQRA